MRRLHRSAWISCFVLLAYGAGLGIGLLTPFVSSAGLQVVCLGNGGIKLVAVDVDSDDSAAGQPSSCPLCQSVVLPPTAADRFVVRRSPLARALAPVVAAQLAALVRAPLPARGPPLG